jgi:hypothetical protein
MRWQLQSGRERHSGVIGCPFAALEWIPAPLTFALQECSTVDTFVPAGSGVCMKKSRNGLVSGPEASNATVCFSVEKTRSLWALSKS